MKLKEDGYSPAFKKKKIYRERTVKNNNDNEKIDWNRNKEKNEKCDKYLNETFIHRKLVSLPVWPDVRVKSIPIFSKTCPKSIHSSLR